MKVKPKILVLGNTGMLGKVVFRYLSQIYPDSVWGTSRLENHQGKTFFFDASTPSELPKLLKKIGNVSYMINCIGILRGGPVQKMKIINADFPQMLGNFGNKQGIRIIHVSTDGVFGNQAGQVIETDIPEPPDEYGRTKLQGESKSPSVISFRTSFIGYTGGLMKWVRSSISPIPGFTNQIWSGCTVLQFAELCEKIISQDNFDSLRKKSPIFHFVPIQPLSKYQLVKGAVKLMNLEKSVEKTQAQEITRVLQTKFEKELGLHEFTNDYTQSLKDLIEYERMQCI